MDGLDCAGCRQRDAIIEELNARVAVLEQLVAQLQEQLAERDRRLAEQGQRLAELEARLKTNSSNSSLPPSSNPPSAPKPPPKPPTGRKPGAQPGHPGHARVRRPAEQIISYIPERCECCQTALSAEAGPADPPERWFQVLELPPTLVRVTEHQGHGRACPACDHVTWASIPPAVTAHGFGPNLTATVGLLSGMCHDSKRTIEAVCTTLFGGPMSLGSVANAEQEVSAALEQPYAQAEAAVRAAAVKNADETGWSKAGVRRWLWLGVAAGVALFKIYAGRGHAALAALLGTKITGIVGSDRWTAYGIIDLLNRQLCWAHLKRDFQKWVDIGGAAAGIGQAGLEAVRRLFCAWGDLKAGRTDRPGLVAALGPVGQDLRAALEAGLSCPDKKAARFCRNILAVWPALWTFVHVQGVEPTNNLAERTLRPAVLWRKGSFGNHSEAGCRFTERILTVVQTLRLQNRHVLAYLRHAVAAHRAAQPPPALLMMEA